MRKSVPLFAAAIPRHVWDPTRHNPNWADSYSTEIVDRRHWPAKKWTIGLEPRTPDDWRNFSKRNLAYAYNAALRSCGTFPEMIPFYQEMKQRGVKVDLDTMNTLLTRAARYEKIQIPDVFELFDEMVELGAKPDLATAETLHTVWDHSAGSTDEAWRETRRQHLIRVYNTLAEADIAQYAGKNVPHLLAAQMKRYRENIRELGATLDASVYKQYLSTITTFPLLIREVHNFMWDLVPMDHEAVEYAPLDMRIPVLATAMHRPRVTDPNLASVTGMNFQDYDVCSVFQSAVERIVDHPLQLHSDQMRRRAYLSLLALITTSRIYITSDLLAQLMDMVKYSGADEFRDRDATMLLNASIRAASTRDEIQRLWSSIVQPCDARVVGRYIAARNPWSPTRFCPTGRTFGLFKAADTAVVEKEEASSAVTAATDSTEVALTSTTTDAPSSATAKVIRTAADVEARWNDLQALLEMTKVRTSDSKALSATAAAAQMEIFSGLAMFLRHMFTQHRVIAGNGSDDSNLSFAPETTMDVCRAIFSKIQTVKRDLDTFLHDVSINHGDGVAEPELECWESLLVVLRGTMDFIVLNRKSIKSENQQHQQQQGEPSDEDAFFLAVSELRSQMVEESRTRFNGRFRMLWLQEA